MKKIFVMFIFLLSLFWISSNHKYETFAAEEGSTVTITINDRLPRSLLIGADKPDLKTYFILRINNQRTDLLDEHINDGGLNMAVAGDYTITATYTVAATETEAAITVSKSLVLKVITSDTIAPVITVNRPFLPENEFGQIPWDSQESMISLMDRFTIYDEVDGQIVPNETMFEGIEDVKTNQHGEEFTIFVSATDKAGNIQAYGEIRLLIVNTTGSVLIEVNEDLPTEFIVNSTEPNFYDYFKVSDNIREINDYQIRRGGFDITKVGIYTISVTYSRPYVFDTNRDLKRVNLVVEVIEADVTAPEIITFRIDDNYNAQGQLPWTYMQSLDIFVTRFRVKDNVDGFIEVTKEMFKDLDKVDISQIDTEFIVTFEVTDKAGNIATKEIKLFVVDDIPPYITNFQNRYYSINSKVDILKVSSEIGIEDNYDKNERVLKIVISNKDLFKEVKLSYHDLERYKDRFTEEELKNAANAYNYELVDGTYTVDIKAFINDEIDNLVYDGQVEITVLDKQIVDLSKLYETLGLSRDNGLVQYYITNYETDKNGEFVLVAEAVDTSNNMAPNRPLRIVIENGPNLFLIILFINVAAIVIFGGAVGLYFGVRKSRTNREVSA